MTIRILASAKRDLEEGSQFYKSQETGLGDYFQTSVSADIERLKVTGASTQLSIKITIAPCVGRFRSPFFTSSQETK